MDKSIANYPLVIYYSNKDTEIEGSTMKNDLDFIPINTIFANN